ncbi:MAG: type II secretion system F family protein [Chloroflexi bacterium]|nr:MAG: type II secretion system F family protein [Chloroflexota bacterium]RLC90854.1 MAG: type II secretion system F family protein [Chloroflexota bacterium]
MEIVVLAVIGLLILVGLLFIIIGLARQRQPDSIEDRLARFGALERPPTLEEIELARPLTERVLAPLLRSLAQFVTRFTPRKSMEAIQHKLDLAGNPYGWGPREFWGIRLLAALLLGGLGFAVLLLGKNLDLLRRVLLVGAAVGLGYYLPVLWLGRKIRRRQHSIIRSLPNALDLLTICVEAGLSFEAAMARVAEKWDDDLSLAFRRVLQEIQLGKLRRDALRDMSDRMEVPDVATFVAAIIQAEQLGVSIARVLRIQSDQMRVRRRQRAEELARAATLKILPPVAFLIFPAIFIVLLGPAAIKLMTVQIPAFNLFGFP